MIADKTQERLTVTEIRFKVTACLYLIPNNRARSRSTLIAASVNKDTELKIKPMIVRIANVLRQISHRLINKDAKYVTRRGCVMIPTQRSVVVKLRSKSLDGG